jgi:GNAT superfamily N-acetyltransferase
MAQAADGDECVVGTLDVVFDYSAGGEVLRGNDSNAMYMINVCVADIARRRGVGQKLVAAAKSCSRENGVHWTPFYITLCTHRVAEFMSEPRYLNVIRTAFCLGGITLKCMPVQKYAQAVPGIK